MSSSATTPLISLRLGARASPLSRWQAEWVAAKLRERGHNVELVPISTRGDREQKGPISSLGGDGVFTKEIQKALLDERIDLAVHSLKDLPTAPVAGLTLAAIPVRGPVGDAWLSPHGTTVEDLPRAARVGTGSLRRRAQLWHVRPDLRMMEARGNVDTRVKKLEAGEFDALVLAEAGLTRLGIAPPDMRRLPTSLMVPAVGQGALGIETRAGDTRTIDAVGPLDDRPTRAAVFAERSLLAELAGGCLAPIGAWARPEGSDLLLEAVVLSHDGQTRLHVTKSGDSANPEALGKLVAHALLADGAGDLISASRGIS